MGSTENGGIGGMFRIWRFLGYLGSHILGYMDLFGIQRLYGHGGIQKTANLGEPSPAIEKSRFQQDFKLIEATSSLRC